ncbi:MAG: hypothetical protein LBF61_11520, partial [Azoarcus sp.]|nr:hypothetical protein [Azoarcus sp.]
MTFTPEKYRAAARQTLPPGTGYLACGAGFGDNPRFSAPGCKLIMPQRSPAGSPAFNPLTGALRALSIDAIQKANSGHPGAPLGMAEIAEVLWRRYLR